MKFLEALTTATYSIRNERRRKVERRGERVMKRKWMEKRRPRASNGQRYPLPYRTHFGYLKCAQQGKGVLLSADYHWPWAVFFKILKFRQGSGPEGDDVL